MGYFETLEGGFCMIRGYLGKERQGKTYSMIRDATLEHRGRPIYANFNVNIPGVECHRLENPLQIVELESCLLLLDEIWIWFPSFLWKRIPEHVMWRLGQQAKRGVDMYYTSQFYGRVFKTIRELTWELVYHEKFFRLIKADIYSSDINGKAKYSARRWLYTKPSIWNLYNTREEVSWVWDESSRKSVGF